MLPKPLRKAPYVGRTAPSASGNPRVGTLYSAWRALCRATAQGGSAWIRIDDLDESRVKQNWVDAIVRSLFWLGFRAERIVRQSDHASRYADALDRLAQSGALYQCICSKARIRALGRHLPAGGFGYDNACRHRTVAPNAWRRSEGALRAALPPQPLSANIDGQTRLVDVSCAGDPIVRRRDGTFAYAFASVVDDTAMAVTEIVRGRDLRAMLGPQLGLFHLLDAPIPAFRHHRLLLRRDGRKWSKSKGDGRAWKESDVAAMVSQFTALHGPGSEEGDDDAQPDLLFLSAPLAGRARCVSQESVSLT